MVSEDEFDRVYQDVVQFMASELSEVPVVCTRPPGRSCLLGGFCEVALDAREAQAIVQRRRYLSLLRMLEELSAAGANLLDIGASPFAILAAKTLGCQVTVVDLSTVYKELLEEYAIPLVQCDLVRERLPLDNDSFDLIMFGEVMEHLPIDPVVYLREFARVLDREGALVLTTPNVACLKNRVRLLLGYHISAMFGPEPDGYFGHIREYTYREVLTLLNEAGFVVQPQWSGFKMFFDNLDVWRAQGLLSSYVRSNLWRLPLLSAYRAIVWAIPSLRYGMCFVCSLPRRTNARVTAHG
ncbi:class I SAM-dependent methyltransferase [Chloroflexota bacterium]